jgi:hypothetical protein
MRAAARAAMRRGSSRMRRLPGAPRLVEERQRGARRLTGARRRNEHSARMLGKRRAQLAEHIVDRQRRSVGHARFLRNLGG